MTAIRTLRAKLAAWYRRWPNPIKAGWNTAWLTFTGLVVSIITGLLGALSEGIASGDMTVVLDHLHAVQAALLSAITAAIVGALNAIYRAFRPIEASYNGMDDNLYTTNPHD